MKSPKVTSHSEALKSSSLIGGSTAISMLIRMVRSKVIAVVLGPAGVGLESILDSILTFTRTLFELGVSSSAVRQISMAPGGEGTIAETISAVRRISLYLGLTGAAGLFLARDWVSEISFGNTQHSQDIAILAVGVAFAVFSGGLGAVLQGQRRIADIARVTILGTAAGVAVTIPIVLWWGASGIPYYMALTALANCILVWYRVRNVPMRGVSISARRLFSEARGLFRLGIAFLLSSLMATGALFLLRIVVVRISGQEGAGLFQAASALSMVYVGFVLQAMGTDFYPRLSAVATDHARCNQLVNEQSEVSLLLALPGIMGTIAFAPWVVRLLYSPEFAQASSILEWQMVGNFLRIISWPMGFILLAQGRGTLFVITDVAAWAVYLGMAWLGLQLIGLPGIGIAFVVLYAFHILMIFSVVSRCSGFRWSAASLRLMGIGAAAVAATFLARVLLPEPWATLIGATLTSLAFLSSLREIIGILGSTRLNQLLAKLRLPFRVASNVRTS